MYAQWTSSLRNSVKIRRETQFLVYYRVAWRWPLASSYKLTVGGALQHSSSNSCYTHPGRNQLALDVTPRSRRMPSRTDHVTSVGVVIHYPPTHTPLIWPPASVRVPAALSQSVLSSSQPLNASKQWRLHWNGHWNMWKWFLVVDGSAAGITTDLELYFWTVELRLRQWQQWISFILIITQNNIQNTLIYICFYSWQICRRS